MYPLVRRLATLRVRIASAIVSGAIPAVPAILIGADATPSASR